MPPILAGRVCCVLLGSISVRAFRYVTAGKASLGLVSYGVFC